MKHPFRFTISIGTKMDVLLTLTCAYIVFIRNETLDVLPYLTKKCNYWNSSYWIPLKFTLIFKGCSIFFLLILSVI